ncbi:hypothetical protein GGR52DRAFT_65929 [Hypoxylon sp. FL1284]|nr:hypothetical protein GGR52DRAFT_65929 [Hypoxylon sp. FL1284]
MAQMPPPFQRARSNNELISGVALWVARTATVGSFVSCISRNPQEFHPLSLRSRCYPETPPNKIRLTHDFDNYATFNILSLIRSHWDNSSKQSRAAHDLGVISKKGGFWDGSQKSLGFFFSFLERWKRKDERLLHYRLSPVFSYIFSFVTLSSPSLPRSARNRGRSTVLDLYSGRTRETGLGQILYNVLGSTQGMLWAQHACFYLKGFSNVIGRALGWNQVDRYPPF